MVYSLDGSEVLVGKEISSRDVAYESGGDERKGRGCVGQSGSGSRKGEWKGVEGDVEVISGYRWGEEDGGLQKVRCWS